MVHELSSRRGVIAVLVAMSLVILVGILAISIDGGLLLDQRRRLQAATDAAALAAAIELYARYPYDAGRDTSGQARSSALVTAAANGFGDGGGTTVTVSIPPVSGLHVGNPGYAEVVIASEQPRGFSGIFGQADLQVTARAVAMGKWTELNKGIIVLDPLSKGSLTLTGQAETIMVGAGVVVNSNNPQAAITTGQALATAPLFDITGVPGVSTSGQSAFNGAINCGVPPTPDPFRYLPEPDTYAVPVANGGKRLQLTGKIPSGGITLSPGRYLGGININTQDTGTVRLLPGLYYMDGGGFRFAAQSTIIAEGVMIYNDPILPSDEIHLSGWSNVRMSPIAEGIYRGLTVFQRRSATHTIHVTGQGGMNITGSFYAAHGGIQITGEGESNNIGSQYIVWQATLDGQGSINVT